MATLIKCTAVRHSFVAPVEVVGGNKENPGYMRKNGLDYTQTTVCRHCGVYRHAAVTADRDFRGHTSTKTTYRPADAKSLRWVKEAREADIAAHEADLAAEELAAFNESCSAEDAACPVGTI